MRVEFAFRKKKKKDCNYSAAETCDSLLFEEGISNNSSLSEMPRCCLTCVEL